MTCRLYTFSFDRINKCGTDKRLILFSKIFILIVYHLLSASKLEFTPDLYLLFLFLKFLEAVVLTAPGEKATNIQYLSEIRLLFLNLFVCYKLSIRIDFQTNLFVLESHSDRLYTFVNNWNTSGLKLMFLDESAANLSLTWSLFLGSTFNLGLQVFFA